MVARQMLGVLGVHGWSGRSHALAGAIGTSTAPAAASSAPPSGSGGSGSAPASSPSAAPSSAAPAQGPGASPAPTPGPKLSAQSFASYSFQIWPGTPSPTAKLAETGLSISVKKQGSGLSVVAGVAGQSAPAAKYYPTGAKVYVIEATLGDDSGSDFNLGDDGLIVTDSQGRILQ